MNLSPIPKTPVRTPQTSGAKGLQLTPIWENVLKSRRIPADVSENSVFEEIAARLEDLEWPVRQHAFRVLHDLMPVVSKDRLDERIVQNDILNKLIANLGHPAPGVRKVATETIRQYLKQTRYSEKMLESFVVHGVGGAEDGDLAGAGVARENVVLGTIASLVDVLEPFVFPENGGYAVSQPFLDKIVAVLSERMKSPLYQEKCYETLWKLREMIGETRFARTLDRVRDRSLVELIRLRELHDKLDVNANAFRRDDGDAELANSVTTYHNYRMIERDKDAVFGEWTARKDDDSGEYSDDTYTKEGPCDEAKLLPDADSAPSSPRVVLETEIQFSEDKAIKMTIVEDERGSAAKDNEIDLFPAEARSSRFVTEDGDLIMKILRDGEYAAAAEEEEGGEEEERKRTPRRVRFGGEVIKLRTPDSDAASEPPEAKAADATTKVDKLVVHDGARSRSQIPVPIAPATKSPRPPKKTLAESSEAAAAAPPPPPSPRSPRRPGEDDHWKWTELALVADQTVLDLKNEGDWKVQHRALEELKVVLINPKVVERIAKAADEARLASLFKFLLRKVPERKNHQVTALSVSAVFQLVQTLPRDAVRRNVADIVVGLCRYVGGCKNVNLKIESVQSLKMLFGIVDPSSVIDILLEHCLSSSSSKMRENSLLAVMYATMTFPSDVFDVRKIAERVSKAAADSRRRVRHAALEALSVLSQFSPPEKLLESVGRAADALPCNAAKDALVSAVQARLSRRVLPTVSNEGLVLYSLQIPASRRFGSLRYPSGADVDWILAGTGSVSTGSARSRGQLDAAQRLDLAAVSPPTKWRKSGESESAKREESANPWTMQKNRNESGERRSSTQDNWKNRGNRFYRATSTGNLAGHDAADGVRFASSDNLRLVDDKTTHVRIYPVETEPGLRPEDTPWALVPVSSLEEQQLARIRSNQLWGEFGIENGAQYISSPIGTLRPLYLKIPYRTPERSPTRAVGADDVRRSSFSYGSHRGAERRSEDAAQVRVLTPSILREKNRHAESCLTSDPNASTGRIPHETDGQARIPPLHSSPSLPRNAARETSGSDRKALDDGYAKANGGPDPSQPPVLFPNIHGRGSPGHGYACSPGHKPPHYGETDDSKLQETANHLDGLLTTSKGFKPGALTSRSPDTAAFSPGGKSHESETILPLRSSPPKKTGDAPAHTKFVDLKGSQSPPSTVASAPAFMTGREQAPSTSSSNSTDFGGSLRLQRLKTGSGALDNGCNPKAKSKRIGVSKTNKVSHTGSPFPDNLKPFERPKEGLETCFNQLESQQWEVVMLGLTSLVRLLRHHPAIVLGQIHPIIMALGRQIRNLRSQVSRAACQAAAEMFVALKRNIEVDLEELAGPLFHRCADTNRFIRLDCGQALDNMTDNVSPARAINVIISKGSMHQNAVVRTVAARLLLRLSEKVGPEKILSLPRETRDRVVQTGANLLMEGKLETRAFAKELFRVWSSHPSFSNLMLEAIPPNVMRHISKTLITLKT